MASCAARSRRLNTKPFGRPMPSILHIARYNIIFVNISGDEHFAMDYVRSFVYNIAQASHYFR